MEYGHENGSTEAGILRLRAVFCQNLPRRAARLAARAPLGYALAHEGAMACGEPPRNREREGRRVF
jgi:hypothetical protein